MTGDSLVALVINRPASRIALGRPKKAASRNSPRLVGTPNHFRKITKYATKIESLFPEDSTPNTVILAMVSNCVEVLIETHYQRFVCHY